MKRVFKIVIISFCSVAFLAVCFVVVAQLSFSGVFDKKYTGEELTENFIKHEKEFSDVAAYFISKMPKANAQKISVGVNGGDKMSLLIYPTVIDSASHIIGGDNLELNSLQMDSALTALGWTKDIIITLTQKLAKTKCDWIGTTESYYHPIEMYPKQSGWGSYTYLIFNTPIHDSLVPIFGKPLSNYGFGNRVVLNYTTAL